ncbi:MAG: adenylate/guanylate cyclase domain-containing protein [Thermodesulfobacteriota bacterium]
MGSNDLPEKVDDLLYSSRNIKNYIEYTTKNYPDVNIESLLQHAGITIYELEDQGHWFSQRQVDRFHDILEKKTGDPNISREVGRYAASSKASTVVKQYVLGFMTPAAAYWVVKNLASRLTRAHTFATKKIGPESVEITSIPRPGVVEKPYQCEARIGLFEALSKLFTHKFAKIEHPACIHRGDAVCRYIITWEKTASSIWKRIRNYFSFFAVFACGALFLFLPPALWIAGIFFFLSGILGLSFYSEHLEKLDLARNLDVQGDVAKDLLDEINIRYNDALLVKEIGQTTSKLLDIQELLRSFIDVMQRRLDFDRAGIWLASPDRKRLCYTVGFGYNEEAENILKQSDFHLDHPKSKGPAVKAFRQQQPQLVSDVADIEGEISRRSLEFVKKIGSQAFICVPIVYERESLGVLFVDNIKSRKSLSQTDISLLTGIAPQIGISIHNAVSYQRIDESREREENLRKLFEKYLPSPIIKQYLNSEEMDLFRGDEISITAIFLDIRRFTSSSETMEARETVSFLNNYFEKCSQVIGERNGHINKYTGDGFLAIFGAPEPVENHSTMAFNAAGKILEMSGKFILGGKPMSIGIGLHTGMAILGNIGSQTKMEYTAVGDTVNTAARLQELTKIYHDYPIIMSRTAWETLEKHPYHDAFANLGMQRIRGKKGQLEAFGYRPVEKYPLSLFQKDTNAVTL